MQYTFAGCVVDEARLEIWRDGTHVHVEPQVFDVLLHLLHNRDRVVPKRELLDQVWGSQFVTESTLTSRIKSARQAVGDDGAEQAVIRTARGRGFRFVAEVEEIETAEQDPEDNTAGTTPARPSVRALPTPVRSLVGRADELDEVTAALRRSRIVTVLGPGGVGKTSLATTVATAEQAGYGDGACWCDWSAVDGAGAATAALAGALGATTLPGHSVEESVVAAVGARELLLVADNCEHVIDEVAQLLLTLVTACPNLVVLATSRAPLAVPGEALFLLAPLASGTDPERPDGSDAATLFLELARDADPGFMVDNREEAVELLCSALDGLPLAIELAAARLRTATLEELVTRLGDSLHLDAPRVRGRVPRHETLIATIAWSHDLLTPRARHLLRTVSVFPAGFSAADLVALVAHLGDDTATTEEALAELVDQSLVLADRSGRTTRFRMLETIRAFGRSLLDWEQGRALRRAHAAWVRQVAAETDTVARGPDEAAAVARFDEVFADLRAAHTTAAAEGDAETALALVVACQYYAVHRLRDEAFTWAGTACRLPGARDADAFPAALGCYAHGMAHRGDLAEGRALAAEAVALCAELDPRALWPLRTLSNVALYEGRLEDALACSDREVAISSLVGDLAHSGYAHVTHVLVHAYRGDAQAARKWVAHQTNLAEELGNPTQLAWARYCHGELLADLDPEAAQPLLEEAVAYGWSVDSGFVVGVSLVTLASAHLRKDQLQRAGATFERVIRLWRQRGDWTHLWTTLRNIVELVDRIGHPAEAAWLLGACADPELGAASYGEAQARLERLAGSLEDRLGSEEFLRQVRKGEESPGDTVVDACLSMLSTLRDATSGGAGPERAP